jgi:DNA-binding cell septation regulator SpoVG
MTDGTETQVITASVNVELLNVQRLVSRGNLRALVSASISIGGVEFTVHGLGVYHEPKGWCVRVPQYKNSQGIWSNAIEMDQSLLNSVMELVAEEIKESRDPRNSRK